MNSEFHSRDCRGFICHLVLGNKRLECLLIYSPGLTFWSLKCWCCWVLLQSSQSEWQSQGTLWRKGRCVLLDEWAVGWRSTLRQWHTPSTLPTSYVCFPTELLSNVAKLFFFILLSFYFLTSLWNPFKDFNRSLQQEIAHLTNIHKSVPTFNMFSWQVCLSAAFIFRRNTKYIFVLLEWQEKLLVSKIKDSWLTYWEWVYGCDSLDMDLFYVLLIDFIHMFIYFLWMYSLCSTK